MNTQKIKQVSGRLSYLDGLRGTAALFVVLHHFVAVYVAGHDEQDPFLINLLSTVPFKITNNGAFCVFTFFVLSGFVLSESVANGKSTLQARLIARYFRLTVPMVASLIFAWVLILLFWDTRLQVIAQDSDLLVRSPFVFSGKSAPLFHVLRDGFYGVYLSGVSHFNPVVWTMRKELIGSFAIYFVYRFTPKKYLLPVIFLFGCLTLAGPDYLGFPIGAALREAWSKGWLKDTLWAWVAFGVAFVIGCDARFNFMAGADPANSALTTVIAQYAPYFYSVAAGLLVFSILTLPVLRAVLDAPVPRFLGRISFALYLVHVPILTSIVFWIGLHLSGAFYLNLAILFLVFMAITLAVAWLMTVVLDEPLTSRLHHVRKLPSLRNLAFPRRSTVVPIGQSEEKTAS